MHRENAVPLKGICKKDACLPLFSLRGGNAPAYAALRLNEGAHLAPKRVEPRDISRPAEFFRGAFLFINFYFT